MSEVFSHLTSASQCSARGNFATLQILIHSPFKTPLHSTLYNLYSSNSVIK